MQGRIRNFLQLGPKVSGKAEVMSSQRNWRCRGRGDGSGKMRRWLSLWAHIPIPSVNSDGEGRSNAAFGQGYGTWVKPASFVAQSQRRIKWEGEELRNMNEQLKSTLSSKIAINQSCGSLFTFSEYPICLGTFSIFTDSCLCILRLLTYDPILFLASTFPKESDASLVQLLSNL